MVLCCQFCSVRTLHPWAIAGLIIIMGLFMNVVELLPGGATDGGRLLLSLAGRVPLEGSLFGSCCSLDELCLVQGLISCFCPGLNVLLVLVRIVSRRFPFLTHDRASTVRSRIFLKPAAAIDDH